MTDSAASVYDKSPSGATLTCRYCGSMYDNHPEVGDVPPVGDGCDMCSASEEELDGR